MEGMRQIIKNVLGNEYNIDLFEIVMSIKHSKL
jgi:hypothetical protein